MGSRLRDALVQDGWRVRVAARRPRPGDDAVSWSLGRELPQGSWDGVEALVHCAYDMTVRDPADVQRVNVDGSRLLLRSAAAAGVHRIVFISSMSAYPGTTQVYGRAKLAIEEEVLRLHGISVRPGLIWGDDPGGMVGALLALSRLPVVPVLRGTAKQFPVHEDDVTRTLLRLLDTRMLPPGVVGLAQPQAVPFEELLRALAAREGRRVRAVPVPWRLLHLVLRAAELLRVPLPVRADSLLGLVRPAGSVPLHPSLPDVPQTLRTFPSLPVDHVWGRRDA